MAAPVVSLANFRLGRESVHVGGGSCGVGQWEIIQPVPMVCSAYVCVVAAGQRCVTCLLLVNVPSFAEAGSGGAHSFVGVGAGEGSGQRAAEAERDCWSWCKRLVLVSC